MRYVHPTHTSLGRVPCVTSRVAVAWRPRWRARGDDQRAVAAQVACEGENDEFNEDVACFEQEVAVHRACAARPIEGLVKFVGYGFSGDGASPEVRGFIVMGLVEGAG